MEILPPILAMLTLVAFSGLLSRNSVAIPLPLLQVALGAVAAWPTHGLRVSMDLQLFMGLFIPPLLFADGWQMPKREFGAYRSAILGLSIGLVLITIFVLGWVIHWMIPSIPLPLSFLLAAVLSPTDAVAVSGIVRGRAMPPRLQHVLEGESLMNDATALVAMKVALAAALTEHFSMRQALSEFVAMACGGLLVGAGFSWCFMRLYDAFLAHGTQRHGATVPTVLLLFLMPFAPYMIAERLEFSGVLAAVAAGMTASLLEVRHCRFNHAHLQAKESWSVVSFAFHGLVFILLGSQLPTILGKLPALPDGSAPDPIQIASLAFIVIAVILVLYALRMLWFLAAQKLPSLVARFKRRNRFTTRTGIIQAAVGTLGGIRGAITLAAIVGVPSTLPDGTPFPARDLLVFIAAMVILISLALGGTLLPKLLNKPAPRTCTSADRADREAIRAEHRACMAVLQMLNAQSPTNCGDAHPVCEAIRAQIDRSYRHRLGLISSDSKTREFACEALILERHLRLEALQAERRELQRLRLDHQINDTTLFRLVHEIDLQERLLRYRE